MLPYMQMMLSWAQPHTLTSYHHHSATLIGLLGYFVNFLADRLALELVCFWAKLAGLS